MKNSKSLFNLVLALVSELRMLFNPASTPDIDQSVSSAQTA